MGFDGVSKIARGYQKCQEGIEYVRRVSKMYEGYQKIQKLSTEFRQGIYRKQPEVIGNVRRVSEILGGHRKCTKGIGKLKN